MKVAELSIQILLSKTLHLKNPKKTTKKKGQDMETKDKPSLKLSPHQNGKVA